VTAWGHILTSAEEALQPHCKHYPIRPQLFSIRAMIVTVARLLGPKP
jgi:hypothetical protein